MRQGVTLIEILIVVVIVGVLGTLGFINYGSVRENALDKEGRANLELIMAAQRIYSMETSWFFDSTGTAQEQLDDINDVLKLALPASADRNWDYLTEADNTADPHTCCAEAGRLTDARTFRMRNTEDEPQEGLACP